MSKEDIEETLQAIERCAQELIERTDATKWEERVKDLEKEIEDNTEQLAVTANDLGFDNSCCYDFDDLVRGLEGSVRNDFEKKDAKILDLEAKLAIAIDDLEILKVAVNDKQPDPGAVNFIAKTLSKLQTPDASPIETRAQTEERVFREAVEFAESCGFGHMESEGKRKGYIK